MYLRVRKVMPLPVPEEVYQWVKEVVGDDRLKVILDTRKRVSEVLSESIFHHYTKHDVEHCDRIVQTIGKLLEVEPKVSLSKLVSSDETFILVMAALLHDIGMQLPLAHKITKDVKELTSDDLENIRARHGEVSALVLRQTVSTGKDVYQLGILRQEVVPYVPYIAELCEHHQSSTEYEPRETTELGSDYCSGALRTGMLTGFLRLSDELDCDWRRVDIERLEQFAISPQSKLYWYDCSYVLAVSIANGRIVVSAAWPEGLSTDEAGFLGTCIISKIEKELKLCKDVLWENGIKLDLNPKVLKKKSDYSINKKPIPAEVLEVIRAGITGVPASNVSVDPAAIGEKVKAGESIDWMSYWGMIGNPFMDFPLSYGSASLVVTGQFRKISAEIGSYLSSTKGELRLLVAKRGQGKTTLFQHLQGAHSGNATVGIVDVGDSVANIRNVADLTTIVFGSIYGEINPVGESYSQEDLLDWAGKARKRLICVDSLDRLTKEQDPLVRDFFTSAQHTLTQLKQNVVLLMSCSDRWLKFIDTEELSYLGARNQWELESLSIKDAKDLLERRLKSTNLSFSQIFDEGCVSAIHTMSEGNPRKLLQYAESICKYAAIKGVSRIDIGFIKENYQKEFEDNFKALIDGLYKESKGNAMALTYLYTFVLEMEKRNLNSSTGWNYLESVLESGLTQESVSPPYYLPIKIVADMYQRLDSGSSSKPAYKPRSVVKQFFAELRKKGYSASDFISFYSSSLYFPSDKEDEVIRAVRSSLLAGDDIKYFEAARAQYDEVIAGKKTPSMLITRAWDAIQNMIVAILVKKKVLDASGYEAGTEEFFHTDIRGIRRYRVGVGQMMADQSIRLKDEFYENILKKENRWMDSWNSLLWVLHTRNNIVRGKTDYAVSYTEKELNLCVSHLKIVFAELWTIYR